MVFVLTHKGVMLPHMIWQLPPSQERRPQNEPYFDGTWILDLKESPELWEINFKTINTGPVSTETTRYLIWEHPEVPARQILNNMV